MRAFKPINDADLYKVTSRYWGDGWVEFVDYIIAEGMSVVVTTWLRDSELQNVEIIRIERLSGFQGNIGLRGLADAR